MISVVCLLDKGSRFPLMVAEGLVDHPGVLPFFNKPVQSLGRRIAAATAFEPLCSRMLGCDLIFLPDPEHFGLTEYLDFIESRDLFGKVVVYDFKDSPHLDRVLLERCKAYFKRSFLTGPERRPLPAASRPVRPFNYGVLNAYVEVARPLDGDRPIDLGYYFDPAVVAADRRRGKVLGGLAGADWSGLEVRIGQVTADGARGRQGVMAAPAGNPWVAFMRLLSRTKIVFNAFPEGWDGDSRTWEAMSSGALCFLDVSGIPTPRYFEDGVHCFFYDAADERSIRDAVRKAREMLAPSRREERERIAARGVRHALSFHRSVHRVDQVLQAVRAEDAGQAACASEPGRPAAQGSFT
ncbi:MAG: glycosyltransferase [bacterium]